MPWNITNENGQYVIRRADTGKLVSHHASKAKAEAAKRIMSVEDRVRTGDEGAKPHSKRV